MKKLSIWIALLLLMIRPVPATALEYRIYLPLIVSNTETVPPPPPAFAMDLTIENRTGGTLCYQVIGVKPIEECMEENGRRYYASIPQGDYKFWGRGCPVGLPVLGTAPFYYNSATLSFACFKHWGVETIWAKMYEME